jgi:sugar-specific transcriptional regulator TrmB
LTDYQAKAYSALLSPKIATAEEVSRLSGVPRSKVYEVLMELQKQGWIKVEKGRPLRYRPKDPRGVIGEKMSALERNVDRLRTELADVFDEGPPGERKGVEIVSGMSAVLEQELELISSAEHIIVFTGSLYFPEELEAVVPLLYRATQKDVTMVVVSRAMVTVDGRTLDIKEALSDIPGRKRFEEADPGIKKMLVDGKRGMVTYAAVDDERGIDVGSIEGLVTGNRVFLEGFNPR